MLLCSGEEGSFITAYSKIFIGVESGFKNRRFQMAKSKMHEDGWKTVVLSVHSLDRRSGTQIVVKETEFKLSRYLTEEKS